MLFLYERPEQGRMDFGKTRTDIGSTMATPSSSTPNPSAFSPTILLALADVHPYLV